MKYIIMISLILSGCASNQRVDNISNHLIGVSDVVQDNIQKDIKAYNQLSKHIFELRNELEILKQRVENLEHGK